MDEKRGVYGGPFSNAKGIKSPLPLVQGGFCQLSLLREFLDHRKKFFPNLGGFTGYCVRIVKQFPEGIDVPLIHSILNIDRTELYPIRPYLPDHRLKPVVRTSGMLIRDQEVV